MLIDYLLESDNKHYHEEEYGFFTYSQEDKILCVWDIYTKPEYRNKRYCWLLFSQIIKIAVSRGCREIEGYVDKDYSQKDRSIEVLKSAGFEYYHETEECLWYRAKVT